MTRMQLVAIVRLLIAIGILLMILVFLRACFSLPMLPVDMPSAPPNAPAGSNSLPSKY